MSRRSPSRFHSPRQAAALVVAGLLAACAGGPQPPDWQLSARSALDHAVDAYLRGDGRAAQQDFDRARVELARTGRVDLLARAELLQCAARVASLEFAACDGFERLRPDAAPAELAYADYLAGRLPADRVALLPPAQRLAAAATDDATAAGALRQISDPVSRLVAAGLVLQAGRASPASVALAVETASASGWRRPLLAWLGVQARRAEQAGDLPEAERLRRRIGWILAPLPK